MATIYHKRPRLEGEVVCVHVVSRVVQKRYLLDEEGMTEMRRMLETQAAFAGIQVITFCFMGNHLHLLLRIDPETARVGVSDAELVARFRALYGTRRSPSLGVNADLLEAVLRQEGERATRTREQLRARMGDVSVFMREFKTRFTHWYNAHRGTVGTFWAERFRSVLVEPESPAARAVAAYIDLNPVRAQMVEKPGAYRFCGLGEAVAGRSRAREGYCWLKGGARLHGHGRVSAEDAFRDYCAYVDRLLLETTGEGAGISCAVAGAPERGHFLQALMERAGALGSEAWVDRLCAAGGLLGFLRRRKARACPVGLEGSVHAGRQWIRASREG